MSFYLLRPCKGKSAFEALPKAQIRIDINRSSHQLKAHGYEITDAGVMLIAKKGDVEISIYPSGKLLIKGLSKEQAFDKVNEIYHTIGVAAQA